MKIAVMIIRDSTIVVGEKSVPWDHVNREQILEAIRNQDFDLAQELMAPTKAIEAAGKGKWSIVDGEVILDGIPVDGLLYTRILDLHSMGLPVDNLIEFERRARNNPSFRTRRDLYAFLEYGKLPIDADGRFIARKVVRPDFLDYHSGTVDWSPGKVVEMDRSKVDDDPNQTCSHGLHVYNVEYGKNFGGSNRVVLAVAVDPADVVAIPTDYNNTKMRVCRAEVLKQLTEEDDPEFFSSLNYGEPREDHGWIGLPNDIQVEIEDKPTLDDLREGLETLTDLFSRYAD